MSTKQQLPLLHKYVLSPHDDMDVKMMKLKYRLCVQEVAEVLLNKSVAKGENFLPTEIDYDIEYDDNRTLDGRVMKSDDSGIVVDDSAAEDLTSPLHPDVFSSNERDEVTAYARYAADAASQGIYLSDERSATPASASSSSPSTSSLSTPFGSRQILGLELEETKDRSFQYALEEDFTECKSKAADDGFFESIHAHPTEAILDQSRLCSENSPSADDDENAQKQHEEHRSKNSAAPDNSTAVKCTNVDDALRILMTRNALPEVTTCKAVVTWSCWNVADLIQGPMKTFDQKPEQSNLSRKYSRELQVANEKIMNREKKLADIYQKILERDEEDQRLIQELSKRLKIPDAEPLPVSKSPSSMTGNTAVRPMQSTTETKEPGLEVKPKEEVPAQVPGRTVDEEQFDAKKKKRRGNAFHSMVHSLQRRFSKRGPETTKRESAKSSS